MSGINESGPKISDHFFNMTFEFTLNENSRHFTILYFLNKKSLTV